ncbi:hypothetical protein ACFW81_02540 [Streptomyces angustmyceticus]|uniref:hypothetical protein n=1 Tax=Streptomyces angustmyceticus TaxID=285578 RepID=UPI0036B9C91E
MKSNKVLACIVTALTVVAVFVVLYSAAGFVTMLLVGALHSAVPVVPAISFVGACWVVTLGLWFRLLFGSSATMK